MQFLQVANLEKLLRRYVGRIDFISRRLKNSALKCYKSSLGGWKFA